MTAGGIATSLLVVILNLLAARLVHFDLLSLSVWVIVPAGALIGGMGAAGGYYLVAKWTQTMPNRGLLFNMVAIGFSTWIMYQWLDYYTLSLEDGTRVRDIASFWEYFRVATEHMQLTISARSGAPTGALGTLGYAREALQLLGFSLGGLAIYMYLTDSEVCEKCRKYTRNRPLLDAASAESFDTVLNRAGVTMPGIADEASQALGNRALAGIDLLLLQCPACQAQWLRPRVVYRTGNDIGRKPLTRFSASADLVARVQESVAVLSKAGVQPKASGER
jgi:hypothetical protein